MLHVVSRNSLFDASTGTVVLTWLCSQTCFGFEFLCFSLNFRESVPTRNRVFMWYRNRFQKLWSRPSLVHIRKAAHAWKIKAILPFVGPCCQVSMAPNLKYFHSQRKMTLQTLSDKDSCPRTWSLQTHEVESNLETYRCVCNQTSRQEL